MATGTQLEKSAPSMPGQPSFGDRLAGLWGQSKVRWAGMPASQRNGALVAGLMLTALIAGLFWYALRTDWRTLYVGMDPDDARLAAQTLAQAQIPFKTTADGTGLEVPAADLDKARLTAAAKGTIKSGRLGFELFDKPNWVGSEFDEQVNYQRALEGELERTVGTLSDVEAARVHLVMPHDSLFRDEERPAKASVVLTLRHRTLADGEPEAIRNLVASAVDGLTADHVVLVDAAGHLPLGPQTAEAMQQTAEQALEEKLVSTLEPVTGPGNVRVSVALDYNDQATEETQETYDPDKTVTLSMQRSEQSAGGQPVAAGVPGAASNAPNTQALPVYPQQNAAAQSAKTESGTYGASKTDRHIVEGPGRVRRMTAAIVVNDRLLQPASKNKAAVWQPRTADELRNLTALAQAAVGFDSTRGDIITVEDLAFEDNRGPEQVSLPAEMLTKLEASPELIKYSVVLLGLLLVLALGVRPALSRISAVKAETAKAPARELAAGAAAAAQAAFKPVEPAEIDPARLRSQEIFEQVATQLKREPTQSSRLLQSWIHSD